MKKRELSQTCAGVKIFRTGLRSCHGDHLDAPWLVRSSCNQGHDICRRRHCSRCRIWGGLGVLNNITGEGNHAITEHPILSHLFLTAALSAMPRLCRPPQSAWILDRGTRQCFLWPLYIVIPHLFPTLSHTCGVVCRPELLLDPVRCDDISNWVYILCSNMRPKQCNVFQICLMRYWASGIR